MMGDTQTLALAQMQWLGECPDPWPINSEIGDLADELPPGQPLVPVHALRRAARAAVVRRTKLGKTSPRRCVASYRNMDDPSIIEPIYELACEAAEKQVKVEHFFPNETATQPLRPAAA